MALTGLTNLQPLHIKTVGIGTFDNTVSIGGTLTYEDVTNVDSVGIITAREAIDLPTDKKILLGDNDKFEIYKTSTHARIINKWGSGSWLRLASGNGVILEADNGNKLVRGIVNGKTELYYSNSLKTETYSGGLRVIGNVAIDDDIVHYGDSDTRIRFPSADTVTVELGGSERVRFGSSGEYDDISGSSNAGIIIGSGSFASAGIQIRTSATGTGRIYFGDNSGNDNGRKDGSILYGQSSRSMQFATAQTERLRIDSSGRLLLGTTTEGHSSADNFTIADAGICGMSIRSGNTSQGNIYFSDDTSANDGAAGEYAGAISYNHSDNGMSFWTNSNNRLSIDSSGHVLPATDNTYNFGSLTKRWANLYTADLNLSNEGKVNDVDGTWGQYTIQEGKDNLYLINKRNGKKYKFLLQEVS